MKIEGFQQRCNINIEEINRCRLAPYSNVRLIIIIIMDDRPERYWLLKTMTIIKLQLPRIINIILIKHDSIN